MTLIDEADQKRRVGSPAALACHASELESYSPDAPPIVAKRSFESDASRRPTKSMKA